MADFEKEDMEDLEEELVVVMTDEEGNEFYYREDMIIPVGEKRYAILVPIEIEEDCGCGEDGCDCAEADVFIARIDIDETGEEVYVDPTDEEFEEVRAAYEQLVEDEDDAE
ncbi:MAG: DUF1292 domain-containing protein [Sporomusaceae bacterium]|nr:DUF1292 domain-containing protein [Sporomusaceae bacterium]